MPHALSSHTKPELRLHVILRALGYTNFITPPISTIKLPCREWPVIPDVLFIREKVVIEVAGEYWHKPSKNKSRKRRIMKDEARKQCLLNNNFIYVEFTDLEVNQAYEYLMDKTKEKYKEKYEKITSEIKTALD